MDIQFRVFDDGVGFRYSFPEQRSLDSVVIKHELTKFTFPEEHQVWRIPVHSENSYYESLYRKNSINETDTINTPATFETSEGLFLAIHEANLSDFASMTLRKANPKQYVSELVPWSNGIKVYAKAPFVSPWRTIIIGEKPGDLVTSTLMLNLNDPCKLEDVTWIEPSKYIGIWWGMHLEKYTWGQGPNHGATTDRVLRYIDFTPGTFNFDYRVIEGTRVNTTLSKQLALYVIIFSPQQMASDLPENYGENPAFEFIKEVPCIWSDTKVMNAEIGKYVTMARKDWNSDEWYIGSITNEEPRIIALDLSFLEDSLDYRSEIYTDGKNADYITNPESVKIFSQVVNSGMQMNLELAAGGGTAIRLVPLQ